MNYNEMTAEGRLQWVQDFAEVMNSSGGRIEQLAKDDRTQWTKDDMRTVQRLFSLLRAWDWAQDFAEKALRFGDFSRRAYRLPVYINKVKEALTEGLTIDTVQGKRVIQVAPGTPLRRRGRPTREATAARMRGEQPTAPADDTEVKRCTVIARLLGMEVMVGEAPREKNNAELKAEREARRAREEKMNPSLFPAGGPAGIVAGGNGGGTAAAAEPQPTGLGAHQPSDISHQTSGVSPCAQLTSDSYEMRMAQDKLHLNQLAWMLSPELAKRTETVQGLRVTAESASERAKLLAEQGADTGEIEPYAQQAKEATEAYLNIYRDVDEELAILHKRLYVDAPFTERFRKRFGGVDVERVQYITRPYYEKMKSPELDLRIKTVIEQDNPEYAKQMKAEEAKKKEISDITKYLMRKDKAASDERVKTMTKRIERLRTLGGDELADSYLPVLEKTKEDNKKWRESKVKGQTTKPPKKQ